MKLILILVATVAAREGVCRALVLSGGGSNGAWEAGVLWGLTHYGNPEDFAYDWISGISAGSINTACLSAWAKGQETEASEYLSYTYSTLTNEDIWAKWPGGMKHAVFNMPSLLDDSPAVGTLAYQTE
jgi:predicted acylesterase/phospholipase RssA